MRRDNEHCEVIIQDKLVEYQRTHTLEIAPVRAASCSKLQITRQEIASLAICAQPEKNITLVKIV